MESDVGIMRVMESEGKVMEFLELFAQIINCDVKRVIDCAPQTTSIALSTE